MNLQQIIQAALREDVGTGDVTTNAIVDSSTESQAQMIAKQAGVFCGVDVATKVFTEVDENIRVDALIQDGDEVQVGDVCMNITGPAASILTAERVALNFVQRLSGIATRARQFSKKLRHAKVYDTRKTTPLLRELERYAVRMGGGQNHRAGLYDAILIKENHIAIAGSVPEAIALVRSADSVQLIEVEVQNTKELQQALNAKADIIMLDNFSPLQVQQALNVVAEHAHQPDIEVSGGITLENIDAYDLPGVHRISVGALTHSVPALDISLLMKV